MTGTWINMGTVLVGGAAGWALGARVPARVREAATAGVGLATVVLGFRLALGTQNVLVLMLAVILGGALGSAVHLAERIELGSRRLEALFRGRPVAEGFLTASLLFCVGPLTVLGAIQDGLVGDWSLLAAKSILDGISALTLAAALGPGVLLSLLVILVYQGGLTLAAHLFASSLAGFSPDAPAVVELSAAGGAVVLALGIGLLKLRDIRAADFLPALLLAPLLSWLFRYLP
ncbi:MAG: DUF554 domain-containing protein [Candidatus Acetothermia bacterium]|jgi:uncharacterized membrane protein YqgA involved in biofilm formation|nr:DUF554 domain-containing protein [Candidatus Acetothermia bacterium]